MLVKWFVDQLVRKMGKRTAEIPKRTMQMLQRYPWPGNIRELKHAIEGAMITAQGQKLNFELPQIKDAAFSDFKSFEEMERDYILQVLNAKNWRIGGEDSAASTLGLRALAGGLTVNELLQDYPELEQADIQAVLAYAVNLVDEKQFLCVSK